MGLKKLPASKYYLHFFFWILVLCWFALNYRALLSEGVLLYITTVFTRTILLAAVVYIHMLWLYPAFYKKKKYGLYILFILLSAIVMGAVNMRFEKVTHPDVFDTPTEHLVFFLIQLLNAFTYIFLSFLLKITIDYYAQKELLKEIQLEKTTAELNFLKAQVNPHFLFNTLNNLYALILTRSDKSAECVLKLADIMKYMLVEGKAEKALLKNEIQLLYNYVELERLRKPNSDIRFETSGETGQLMITPLLLLPLLENAFKFGLNAVHEHGFVHTNIHAEGNVLLVEMKNNIPPAEDIASLQSLGLGVENVKQRLEMLYPGKYVLNATEGNNAYTVHLKLKL